MRNGICTEYKHSSAHKSGFPQRAPPGLLQGGWKGSSPAVSTVPLCWPGSGWPPIPVPSALQTRVGNALTPLPKAPVVSAYSWNTWRAISSILLSRRNRLRPPARSPSPRRAHLWLTLVRSSPIIQVGLTTVKQGSEFLRGTGKPVWRADSRQRLVLRSHFLP
jgi:hypothetical protein